MGLWWGILVLLLSFAVLSQTIDRLFMPSLDRIAARFNLSESVAGATLLAIGTSMPEISTAMISLLVLGSTPLVGVGTIVGSAIFQILMIMGFIGIIAQTTLHRGAVMRDIIVYLLSVLVLYAALWDGQVVIGEAVVMLTLYALYIIFLLWWNQHVNEVQETIKTDYKKQRAETNSSRAMVTERFSVVWDRIFAFVPNIDKRPAWTWPLFVISLLVIGYTTYRLVLAAESVALALGIPAIVVALTILAGGSSLPELLSALVVARKGRGDMAVADALGSNIFDILVSLGLPLLIYTLWKGPVIGVEASDLTMSMGMLLGMVLLLLVSLWINKFRLGLGLGVLFVLIYMVYVIAIVV